MPQLGRLARGLPLLLATGTGLADVPGAPPVSLADGRLIVEAEFSSATGWVQAQTTYTMRLLQAVSFAEAEFVPPQLRLAELRPLGDAQVSEAQRGELRYRVTEQRYAVFPFANGELLAERAAVSGLAVSADGTVGRQVLAPPPARLRVLPLPVAIPPPQWLPARSVTIAETWSPPFAGARVGEPLVRTLRVEARGVDAAQIPELHLVVPGLSAQAGPPRLENRVEGDWLIGTREQSWRIVPRVAGGLTLPEVRLDWWDATVGVQRVASLPARSLMVAASRSAQGAAGQGAAGQGAPDRDSPDSRAATNGSGKPVAEDKATAEEDPEDGPGWLARAWMGLVLSLTLVAAFGFAGRERLRRAGQCAAAWRRLRRACRHADVLAARDAMLAWAAALFPDSPPRTLGQLAARSVTARAAILALDRRCYGPPGQAWDAAALPRALHRDPAFRRVQALRFQPSRYDSAARLPRQAIGEL
jgi:hypothetical protein